MTPELIVSLRRASKSFVLYKAEKTLFRLTKSVIAQRKLKGEIWALKDISLDIFAGDKIAIIGRNGAGKTTLLRIACGIFPPTEGSVVRRGILTPLFQYGIGLNPYLSVLENIYLIGAFHGILVREVKQKLAEILDFSELESFLYAPVKNLSAGQLQRLVFSVFTQVDQPCLAFDEGMTLADLQFQQKAQNYFKRLLSPERTLLMATHDMSAVRQYCQKTLWLEKGEIKMAGDTDAVITAYEKFCLGNPLSV